MSLTMILGSLGSGKTLLATYMAIHSNRDVYANYVIQYDKYQELKIEMLPTLDKGIVILDEGYAWLESRLSGRDINRYLSYILFQSRKRELDFIITTQLVGTIDIRFRELTDYAVVAEQLKSGTFRYSLLYNTATRKRTKIFYLSLAMAEDIWKRYDTMERIEPFGMNEIFDSIASPAIINEKIDNVVAEIKSAYPELKYTLNMVKDYLLRHGISMQYAQFIHTRLSLEGLYDQSKEKKIKKSSNTKSKTTRKKNR